MRVVLRGRGGRRGACGGTRSITHCMRRELGVWDRRGRGRSVRLRGGWIFPSSVRVALRRRRRGRGSCRRTRCVRMVLRKRKRGQRSCGTQGITSLMRRDFRSWVHRGPSQADRDTRHDRRDGSHRSGDSCK